MAARTPAAKPEPATSAHFGSTAGLGLAFTRVPFPEPYLAGHGPAWRSLLPAKPGIGHSVARVAVGWRTVGRNDWFVYGCVLDPQRAPVTALRVRLVGKGSALHELPVAHTDEHGDFFIVVRKDDLAAQRGDNVGLQLRVETEKGRDLYQSEEGIGFVAGEAEYFEILLESPSAADLTPSGFAASDEVPEQEAGARMARGGLPGAQQSWPATKPSTPPEEGPKRAEPRLTNRGKKAPQGQGSGNPADLPRHEKL